MNKNKVLTVFTMLFILCIVLLSNVFADQQQGNMKCSKIWHQDYSCAGGQCNSTGSESRTVQCGIDCLDQGWIICDTIE